MTRFLLATDSVHTTAAACDYLVGRVTGEDTVTVLTVREKGADPRDGGDALNVATARLGAEVTVETETRNGNPADAVVSAAAALGADEVVVGSRGGAPGRSDRLGGTARAVLEAASVPVVVVPMGDLE